MAEKQEAVRMGLMPREELAPGWKLPWLTWRTLNRLRTGFGRCKYLMKKWGYLEAEDTDTYTCGKIQTMHHLLQCGGHCSELDLAMCTDTAIDTANKWKNIL